MSLSGRTIARCFQGQKKSNQTPGKDKGPTCTKSELKEFGRHVNPYKLRGYRAQQYLRYCVETSGMNK